MSYDIYLRELVTGEVANVPGHLMIGGTYKADYHSETGTFTTALNTDAHLNVTYNYGCYYREAYENGIREIYEMQGVDSISVLENMISVIINKYKKNDTWISTKRTKTIYYDEEGNELEGIEIFLKKKTPVNEEIIEYEIKEGDTSDYWLIDLTFSNSFANNIQIGNGILPTEEKIEEMLQIIRQLQVNQDEDKDIEKVNDEQVLEDKAVYLFKVRLSIEKMLNEKMEALGCNNEEILKRNSLISIARRFHEKEFIDDITYHLIVEVVRIANRGIHGEIISDEYIKFVQKAYPQIQYNLKELPNI